MDRVIKFRAWDPAKNGRGEVKGRPQMLYGLELRNEPLWWLLESKMHLMQYTGLKDKNGTEIYEGDVVLQTYNQRGSLLKILSVVDWDSNSARFIQEEKNGDRYGMTIDGGFEVVGNICENPELLK